MMPCEWLKMPDGGVVHIRTSGQRKKLCKFCNEKSSSMKSCDFPVGNGRTCDAEMCSKCARTLGRQETDYGAGMKRINDTIDVCPIHREAVVVDGKIKED